MITSPVSMTLFEIPLEDNKLEHYIPIPNFFRSQHKLHFTCFSTLLKSATSTILSTRNYHSEFEKQNKSEDYILWHNISFPFFGRRPNASTGSITSQEFPLDFRT